MNHLEADNFLNRAKKELASLEAQRIRLKSEFEKNVADTDRKIAALQEYIKIADPAYAAPGVLTALSMLPNWTPPPGILGTTKINLGTLMQSFGVDLGLTESTRQVLRSHPLQKLTPTGIRDLLVENKIELPPVNPLAAIHTVLKRIAESSDPQFRTGQDEGGSWYMYDPTIPVGAPRYDLASRRKRRRAAAALANKENK